MGNKEKAVGILLVALVVVALSGAFSYGYYYGKPGSANQVKESTQNDSMLEQLEKKANASPGDLSAWENLGNAYFDIGAQIKPKSGDAAAEPYFKSAAEAYQKALALDPKRMDIQTDMATSLYYSGQVDQAEQAYKQAIAISPDYVNAHLNYGIFLNFVRNDQEGARRELTKALQLKPEGSGMQTARNLLAELGVVLSSDTLPDYTTEI